MKVSAVIEHDDNGYYAYSPELPGCQTQGDNIDDVMVNIQEAVELYVSTLDVEERNALLSRNIMTTQLEIPSA